MTRFTTEIGADGTIPLPQGVVLPPGKVEVIVLPALDDAPSVRETGDDDSPRIPDIAIKLAHFAETHGAPDLLPRDFALNHDHYLHGAPKVREVPRSRHLPIAAIGWRCLIRRTPIDDKPKKRFRGRLVTNVAIHRLHLLRERQRGIAESLTCDRHFDQAGFKAIMLP